MAEASRRRSAAQAAGNIRAIHGAHPPRLRRSGPSLRDVRFGILPSQSNVALLCKATFSRRPGSAAK